MVTTHAQGDTCMKQNIEVTDTVDHIYENKNTWADFFWTDSNSFALAMNSTHSP